MSGHADSTKAIYYALAANGSIAIAKFIAAFITSSGSMLAEAVHSSADCGNQLLLLLGIKRAKKPPTPDYPLGYGKETYFWSFIVALMLFSLGGLFSIYEGWHKLHEPEPLSYPLVALGVLGFGIIAEAFSMRGCIIEVNKIRGNQNLWQWFRQSRNSELVVIFGEDLAALLGLAFAFIAVSIAWATGNPMWDALGSIGIGVLLIVIAVLIGVEVKAMLVGQGVEESTRAEMRQFLLDQESVQGVFNVLTMQMGPDVMVAIKAQLKPQTSDTALIEAINHIESAFKAQFPQVMWLFFEPDIVD